MNLTKKANVASRLVVLMFFTFLMLQSSNVSARHIIGGDVTYRCLLVDSTKMETEFEVSFILYRDSKSGGAPFNNPGIFGIHLGSDTDWEHFTTLNASIRTPEELDPQITNPCVILPQNIGVEKGEYVVRVVLPWSTKSYKISYQRCCRNNTITNMVNPGESGAAFSIDIPPLAQRSCNNSPRFKNFPPIVICAETNLTFDHSAVDREGDSLVYSFCTPKTAGGTGGVMGGEATACDGVTPSPANCMPPFRNIQFLAPFYSVTNPLGNDEFGNVGLKLNSRTGILTGRPRAIGQYVVGVCVREYRDGVLLSTMQRDFQFNVAVCEYAVEAKLKAEEVNANADASIKEFRFLSCGSFEVDFINLSTDSNYISGYLWEFDVNGDISSSTERNASLSFPEYGDYSGSMVINPESDGCSDTVTFEISVRPDIRADFSFDYDTCIAGPVSFDDFSESDAGPILGWEWFFDDEGESTVREPRFEFLTPGDQYVSLVVKDQNECTDTLTKVVAYNPVPTLLVVEPTKFISCEPAIIKFSNLSTPVDSTYDVLWTFSDGGTSTDLHPEHVFEKAGLYDVDLRLISPIGCETYSLFSNFIEVKNSPVAGFSYTPEALSIYDRQASFTNTSSGAISWFWEFGDGGRSFIESPTYSYRDTGFYSVIQISINDVGCTDTAFAVLDVSPIAFQMPNAFTPNNDNLNDEFKPKGVFIGVSDFEMSVWNRWGQKIFTSEDPEIGWNGTIDNAGIQSQQGVYVYTINYTSSRAEEESVKGQFTLIR